MAERDFPNKTALIAELQAALDKANGFRKRADEALKISSEALDALAIHAAVEVLADRSPDAWIQKFLQVNPIYGKGYALMGFHLVLNRRYEEGVAYYRKAVDLDPRLWPARGGHQPARADREKSWPPRTT